MTEHGTYPIRRPLEVTVTVADTGPGTIPAAAGEQLTATVICPACAVPVVQALWDVHAAAGRPCEGADHL